MAHRCYKSSRGTRFPRQDREYVGITATLKLLQWQGKNHRNDRLRQIVSTISEVLLNNEKVQLDDMPQGETTPATQVFCQASSAPKGGGIITYFSDVHAISWLQERIGLLPKLDKHEYPGFETVCDFTRRLGRWQKDDKQELKHFLIKTLHEGKPIPTASGRVEPNTLIKWFRSGGSANPVLYAKADILEPFVRQHLICGKTDEQHDWLNPIDILYQLRMGHQPATRRLALELILYDLWNNRREEVSDRLGLFVGYGHYGHMSKILRGRFSMRPDAVGELVTRDMVLEKMKEIKGREHRILKNLRREEVERRKGVTTRNP